MTGVLSRPRETQLRVPQADDGSALPGEGGEVGRDCALVPGVAREAHASRAFEAQEAQDRPGLAPEVFLIVAIAAAAALNGVLAVFS